ncbi:MAG: hypothetical protein WED00_02785 [Aquisalimonadaceae bacterium]
MKAKRILLAALLATGPFITPVIGYYLDYYRFEMGPVPPKRVELDRIGPIDPLRDLASLREDASLRLIVGDQSYNNIRIWTFSLENIGKAPITPNDFVEPLSVYVDAPWQLIDIRNSSVKTRNISLNWQRVSKTKMAAIPFLLNPGDEVRQTVYLTADENLSAGRSSRGVNEDIPSKSLHVDARIINLSRFENAPTIWEEAKNMPRAFVYLTFPATIFLLIIAAVFMYIYVKLFVRSGVATRSGKGFLFGIVMLAILSFSTAEVVTYYIFGGNPIYESILGKRLFEWKAQIQNWIVLALHVAAVSFLSVKTRKNDTQ